MVPPTGRLPSRSRMLRGFLQTGAALRPAPLRTPVPVAPIGILPVLAPVRLMTLVHPLAALPEPLERRRLVLEAAEVQSVLARNELDVVMGQAQVRGVT